jgi:hypothetical protein
MAITSIAVAFIAGKRYVSVSIDGRSAATMEVPDALHCEELLGILRPDLTADDRAQLSLMGGGFSYASTTRGSVQPAGISVSEISTGRSTS